MHRMMMSMAFAALAAAGLSADAAKVDDAEAARRYVERLLADPSRPRYHFVIDGNGMPGDSNGAFWHNGRYHLMYLYNRPQGFCWGHSSSTDLLHWRRHPDSLGVGPGDEGCFSGGGFVDDDGTAYLSYWMLWGARGLGIARSMDETFDAWEKFPENPVVKSTHWGWTLAKDAHGNEVRYASADPSNIWKKGGKYYMIAGNLCLLDDNGRKPDSPEEMKGDCAYLFESADLKTWTYRHPFYRRRADQTRATGWTDTDEDSMCPSFLPLPLADGRPSGKHLLLFLSHNRGCQYYIGSYDTVADKFLPERHGRMTWKDRASFAPEALIDRKGRQIAWIWLLDNLKGDFERSGWSGVYALPRSLWLAPDGTLGQAPVDELRNLRVNGRSWDGLRLAAGEAKALDGFPGDCCELELEMDAASATNFALKVQVADGIEGTVLTLDADSGELVFDASKGGRCAMDPVERAPFRLAAGEALKLRVFVDKAVVEVHANDRQSICRRVYPASRVAPSGVTLAARGGIVLCRVLRAWEMAATNPF